MKVAETGVLVAFITIAAQAGALLVGALDVPTPGAMLEDIGGIVQSVETDMEKLRLPADI